LLKEVNPSVATAILEHFVFSLTVDTSRYLLPDTPVKKSLLAEGSTELLSGAMKTLVELADIHSVGESVVCRIGLLQVPAGSPGLTGRQFAGCFLDVAARVALTVILSSISEFRAQHFLESVHYVSRAFCKVHFSFHFDYAFVEATSPQELLGWTENRHEQ
jgi:hypothetical protein